MESFNMCGELLMSEKRNFITGEVGAYVGDEILEYGRYDESSGRQ
jgi:hypothetical protein